MSKVEWKRIWELTTWDKRFQGVDKSMQVKVKQYPYLLAKDLFALSVPNGDVKLLSTGVQEGWTTEKVAGKYLCEGEIVSIPWGKSPGAKNPVKYYNGKFVTGDNRIATSSDTDVLNNKFLYYWFIRNSDLLDTFYRGAGIQHPSMYMVLTMYIPLLPISEQNRIVGILDTFTASIDNLKEQIAQRRKQYEYYRDQLLDLEGKEGVEMKISDFCLLKAGKNISADDIVDDRIGNVFPCIGGNGLRGYVTQYSHEGSYPVIGRQGALCGCVNWITGKFYATEHAVVATGKVNTDQRFLYYLFQNANLNQYKTQGAQPGLSVAKLNNVKFRIPSLQEQQRIVSILDTFEASIQNLEAQLSQREKQYEYNRNKLLTFE